MQDLRQQFKTLATRIESGDDSNLLIWVLQSQLAVCHRPLRHNRLFGGSLRNLHPDATPLIFDWAQKIRSAGIKSIICLLSRNELDLYSRLNLGAADLLDFYKNQGFAVSSVSWEDPAHVRKNPAALIIKQKEISAIALARFDELPKPVLLHCSAGIDRSAPVAAYIREHRAK